MILQAAMVSSWQKCGPILIRPPKAKVFYFDCAWWFIGLWLSCSFNFPSFRQIPECQPYFPAALQTSTSLIISFYSTYCSQQQGASRFAVFPRLIFSRPCGTRSLPHWQPRRHGRRWPGATWCPSTSPRRRVFFYLSACARQPARGPCWGDRGRAGRKSSRLCCPIDREAM